MEDPNLTTIEILALSEAGGCNDLSNAYGAIQLYCVFERLEQLVDATASALLRLFDLSLIRLVEAPPDVGYHLEHESLPALTRRDLVAAFERDRDRSEERRETMIFFDPTPRGEALLDSIPGVRIPRVSGQVRRPWLEQQASLRPSVE